MSHDHDHAHDHDHGAHAHGPGHSHIPAGSSERRLAVAAGLTGAFLIAEVIGGLLAGSLALLADAGHMLTDFAALVLAWFAFRFSRRPPDHRRTYGFDRLQVLVAFANGLALFVIAAVITVEAVRRLFAPVEVMGGWVLVIGILGLLVNVGIYLGLRGGDRNNLNMRGALAHVMGDLLGSAGAIAAGLIIMLTGWSVVDPLISVLVVALILRTAWAVVHDSAHVLLEGAPSSVAPPELKADLQSHVPAVEDVHHVHAWSITEERPMVTLHARVQHDADGDRTVQAIKQRLRDRFGISHATVEIEHDECADEGEEPCLDQQTSPTRH
ncbi:MAG: cation diffusion facilitator family transporter [Bauldia sp.]|nr:cation diffusion facilitator family transporter [Bauldia sp.]